MGHKIIAVVPIDLPLTKGRLVCSNKSNLKSRLKKRLMNANLREYARLSGPRRISPFIKPFVNYDSIYNVMGNGTVNLLELSSISHTEKNITPGLRILCCFILWIQRIGEGHTGV